MRTVKLADVKQVAAAIESDIEKADANGDGNVTQTEVRKAKLPIREALFLLDQIELSNLPTKTLKSWVDDSQQNLAELDRNKNGTVAPSEILASKSRLDRALWTLVAEDAVAPVKAPAVTLTESDDGKTIKVKPGEDVAVRLPYTASSGYQWSVASVDRSLGQPTETREIPDPRPGAKSTQVFTWKTDGPFPLNGMHAVKLQLTRPWETGKPPADTFSFKLNVG